MPVWHEMSEMTSREFAVAMPDLRIALIPVGATEQHGPNLALSTDYVIAHRLCQKLAEVLHPAALVVPPLPFGLSQHHMGFPGTLTLSAETFVAVLLDIARSLKANGIEHLLFVNGHNGNTAVLNVATTKIRYEVGIRTATAFWFQQASDRVRVHARTTRFGHACEVETSVLMALAPELVAQDALEAGDMIDSPLKLAFNNEPFFLHVPIPFHEQTRNGVFGDARLATLEAGEDIVATAVERMSEFVRAFIDNKPSTAFG